VFFQILTSPDFGGTYRILSRMHLQSSNYGSRDDVHKLITINTPHTGAQPANLIKNNDVARSFFQKFFYDYLVLDDIGNNNEDFIEYSLGAVNDLSVNSEKLRLLNTSPNINRNTVPTHVISTKLNYLRDESFLTSFILFSMAPLYSMTKEVFKNYVFGGKDNDGVVTVESQKGDLPHQYYSIYDNQFHIGANNNDDVVNQLVLALDKNSSDSSFFTQNGFLPIDQVSPFRLIPLDTTSHLVEGSISINYPARGQSFNKGNIIPVNISSKNGINRVLFAGINSFDNITTYDTSFSGGNIFFKLPDNAFGKMKLVVIGYENSNYIASDTLTILINQTADLVYLECISTPIYLQELSTEAVTIQAHFNDSSTHIIDNSDGVKYILADTTIAKYFYGNLIYGNRTGETTLTAIYQNKSVTIPVFVTQRDTTIPPVDINSMVTFVRPDIKSTNGTLKVFPNPTNGYITIEFDNIMNESSELVVFSNIGQQVYVEQLKKAAGKQQKMIDLRNMPKGIYIVQIKSPTQIRTQKVVLK
jgi:hypothetical protein